MATNYPGGLDSFNNPTANTPENATGYEHDLQHANVNDAVEAIQAELGINPSGTYSTVKDRIAASEGGANLDTMYTQRADSTYPFADEFTTARSGSYVMVDNPSGGSGRISRYRGSGVESWRVIGGDAAAELHAMMYPYSMAVGDQLQAAFRTVAKANYVLGGLIVSNGTTYGSGAQVFAAFHNPSTNSIRTFTGFNAQVSDVGSATSAQWFGAGPVHYMIKRNTATEWQMFLSPDGLHYMYWTSATYDIGTPTHVGIAVTSWSGASDGVFSCSYLRVMGA